MILLAVMLALAALMLTAAPALAKGNHNNSVNEERGETPRQQAQEENNFNNFGFFPSQCVGLCNFGFENEFEPNNVGFDNGCWWNGCFNNNVPVFTSFVDGNNCFCDDDFFTPSSCTPHQILDLNTGWWIWVC